MTKRISELQILMLLALILCSCNKQPDKLSMALSMSGDNRKELEEVLYHYAKNIADSQKLRAAEFLISNMPGHQHPSGAYIKSYINKIDSVYKDTIPHRIKKLLYNIPLGNNLLSSKIEMIEDIKHIKSDFLISHIDFWFDVWHKSPWLAELTYENFEMYLLPYNCHNELFDPRDNTHANEYITGMQKRAEQYEYIRHFITNYSGFLNSDDFQRDSRYTSHPFEIPDSTIKTYRIDCLGASEYTQYSYRMAGVPSAVDFVPNWGSTNGRHYWSVVIDQTSQHNKQGWIAASLTPKVYRRTYAHNKIPSQQKDVNNKIPFFFENPFYKDVTSEYMNTIDIDIKINTSTTKLPKYAYLGVFNSMNIREVQWSEIKNNKARFKDMGLGLIYYPIYYKGNRQIAAGYPIYANSVGNTKEIIPDTLNTHHIKIERKYPLHTWKILWSENLIGSRIEASNDSKFRITDTLYTISYNPHLNYINIKTDTTKKYRYWRYIDGGKGSYVGEFAIYDTKNNKIKGKYISNEDTSSIEKAFDDDIFTQHSTGSWFGIDAGKPVAVSRIGHSPLSDDNGIVKGELYELFYYSLNGWVSLGGKTADTTFITYNNVPCNAIYWLRNLTKGREERPFTIENGKQRFW